jgi:hypothetical protein
MDRDAYLAQVRTEALRWRDRGGGLTTESAESFALGPDKRKVISVARFKTGEPSVRVSFERLEGDGVWVQTRTDGVRLWAPAELDALERAIARVREIQNEIREQRGTSPRTRVPQ